MTDCSLEGGRRDAPDGDGGAGAAAVGRQAWGERTEELAGGRLVGL